MEKKTIAAKKYLCFETKASHNTIKEIAEKELMKMFTAVEEKKIKMSGPIEFIYHGANDDMDKQYDVAFAIPVQNDEIPADGYTYKTIEGFDCVSEIHKGSLEQLYWVYDGIFEQLKAEQIRPTDEIREVYLNYVNQSSPDNVTEILVGVA